MKLTGMAGVGSGKLGSQVYSAIGNTQIVRNYQPNVANPNTPLQVNVRARFKLLSQLSAAMDPVLAFKHNRLVSARNRFVKKNYDLTSGNDGIAQLTLENLQITSGSAGLPGIRVTRIDSDNMQLELAANAGEAVSRVVYCIFRKTSSLMLQYVRSLIVDGPTLNGIFRTMTENVAGDLVVYAYGMYDLSNQATVRYGNLSVRDGQDIARLVMNRTISFTDYRFTRTRGCQLYADEEETRTVGMMEVRVFLTPSGNGNIEGNGIYDRDESVVLAAQPNEGNQFIGWMQNGGNNFVAYSPTLVVKATSLIDLVAVFQNPESTTGGLNGNELVNPLPYDRAIVEIDGNIVDITSGLCNYNMNFDNIRITGINEGHEFVYVPDGSSYGDDDNIPLDFQVDEYTFQYTGTGSGAIYYDGMVMFFINCEPWENPYPDTAISVEGTNASIDNGKIVWATEPDYIVISGLTQSQIVTATNNADRVDMVFQGGVWRTLGTPVPCPCQFNVDGKPWFVIKVE